MKFDFEVPEEYFEEAHRRECNVIIVGVVLPNGVTDMFFCMGTPVLAADIRAKLTATATESPWPWVRDEEQGE